MTAYDPSDRFASLDASRGKVSLPLTSRSLLADAKDALLQLWKDIRHMDGGITLAVHPAEGE